MYKSLTIRRIKNPETKDLMRLSNEMELGLKHLKAIVAQRKALEQEMKKSLEVKQDFQTSIGQDQVDKIFDQE